MKNLLTTLIVLFSFSCVFGQQILVENNDTTYIETDLQTAVDNAAAGSFIYLPAGTFNTSNTDLLIDKELHIIGVGHYPDSTAATGRTVISNDVRLLTGASNGSLEGVFTGGSILVGSTNSNNDVNNYLIKRVCMSYLMLDYIHTSESSKADLFSIKGCVIRNDIYGANAKNIYFNNNIVKGLIYYFNGNSILFENNLFLYGYIGTGTRLLNDVSYTIFRNNIFFNTYLTGHSNCTYNEFHHNLTPYSYFYSDIVNNNNIYNVANISDLFVNQSGNSFNYNHDYHLVSNGLASGAGISGTDLGIYGGSNPAKDGGVPHNPHIYFKSISASTNAEGKLPVHIKVRAQEN